MATEESKKKICWGEIVREEKVCAGDLCLPCGRRSSCGRWGSYAERRRVNRYAIGTTVDAGLLSHYVRLCDIFCLICVRLDVTSGFWSNIYVHRKVVFALLVFPVFVKTKFFYCFGNYNFFWQTVPNIYHSTREWVFPHV